MKRYIIALFSIILALSLFSCGNVSEIPDGDGGKITSPIYDDDNSTTDTDDQVRVPTDPIVTKVSFLGVGDNIIYRGNVRDAKSKKIDGGREHNFLPAYSSVAGLIKNADIAFVNQETLMTGGELSYYPRFNSPRDLAYDLIEVGFDIINMSNNHMLDKGADGLTATMDFWNTLDVTTIGGYYNEADFENIRIYEEKGIKIALLSFTEQTNGNVLRSDSDIYIPYLNETDLRNQVAAAKECADLVFVSVHWGEENTFNPNDYQKKYANLMAELGVDVILGHHPHVIQPVEWIVNQNGHKTLCVYSLGNFMAEQNREYNMVGGIITFDIVRLNANEPTIENPVFIPTMFHFPKSFYDNHIYFLENYTPKLAAVHGVKTHYGNSMSYERLFKYVKDTVSPEFLPEYYKK